MKAELLTLLIQKTKARYHIIKDAMAAAQEAANEETKSSVGDKYETSRAMAQNELELLGVQLAEVEKDMAILEHISILKPRQSCGTGALINTDLGLVFMATSVGFVEIEAQKIMVVSQASPLGQSLKAKVAGDEFTFRGKSYIVKTVC